jgi:RNA polymerase sigma-54 factor
MVSINQSLQQRQSQQLVMTPQLQLSLKILQFNSLELNEFVENELQNNPLLEAEAKEERDNSDDDFSVESSENNAENSEGDERETHEDFDNPKDNSELLDTGADDSWNTSESSSLEPSGDSLYYEDAKNNTSYEPTDAGSIIEKTYSEAESLRDFLNQQIDVDFYNLERKLIAYHLVDMLDKNGFLSSETLEDDLDNLAKNLGTSRDVIDDVIEDLKGFEPVGVFARNLKDCLKIQLEAQDRLDPSMEKFIDNLELLAKGEIAKLAKICDVDKDEIEYLTKEVKQLNPRPASGFENIQVETKQIDIFLRKEKGKWTIELNNEVMPKVLLNKKYYQEVKAKSKDENSKKYLNEQFASANWLIRAITQRAETMMKVTNELVLEQSEFFENGINYLRPMIMRDIAEKVGVHESTVGRVVNGKYISTPRGVFELKFFFTSSIGNSTGGSDYSSQTVKHQIKELIEQEEKILSDEDIAQILKSRGIDCARRTVAKYREAQNIPTSAERKRSRKIAG